MTRQAQACKLAQARDEVRFALGAIIGAALVFSACISVPFSASDATPGEVIFLSILVTIAAGIALIVGTVLVFGQIEQTDSWKLETRAACMGLTGGAFGIGYLSWVQPEGEAPDFLLMLWPAISGLVGGLAGSILLLPHAQEDTASR
jgi:hypothetical protein